MYSCVKHQVGSEYALTENIFAKELFHSVIGPIVYSHGVYIHSGFSPPLYIYSEFGANFYTLVNLELQGQQRLFSSNVSNTTVVVCCVWWWTFKPDFPTENQHSLYLNLRHERAEK